MSYFNFESFFRALDQAKAKGSYFPALGQFQGRLPKLANLKALKKAITEFLDKIN